MMATEAVYSWASHAGGREAVLWTVRHRRRLLLLLTPGVVRSRVTLTAE